MNYERHYKLLCSSRQQLNRQKLAKEHADYCYYELHHIVPKHENGSNEADNLVLLTAREHFIAHWLFAKWKQTKKARLALGKMIQGKDRRCLNSKQYETCRQAISIANSGKTGITTSQKQKESARNTCKNRIGSNNPNFGKPAWNRGVPQPEEQRLKHSKRMSGENNHFWGKKGPMSGKKHKESSKIKASKSRKASIKAKIATENRSKKAIQPFLPIKIISATNNIFCINTAEEWQSLRQENGLMDSNFLAVAKGTKKSYKGWKLYES